jgi:hypothetical protein
MLNTGGCPSCGSSDLNVFYKVPDVPVNSCFLLSTKEQALTFPRGDIELGFCKSCGFITNLAYDPQKVRYGSVYEDQQCFSSTFNVFAQQLAKRLVEKYDLHNKTVLEVGCGKGDFLVSLCELGPNSGLGIDPAHLEGRVPSTPTSKTRFITDYYSHRRYPELTGDLVCCRHTLEHIPDVFEFVSGIRNSIQERKEAISFFEVPDATRIFKEQAFWDIYYEHCSYFTKGSIARLFRNCGFEVVDLYNDFGDQYLMIEARPQVSFSKKAEPLGETVEEIANYVQGFINNYKHKLLHWTNLVEGYISLGKKIVIWGSGSKCVAFLTTLGFSEEIEYVVDINPYRYGKFIPGLGKQIMAPSKLKEFPPDIILVMNPVYLNEIKNLTRKMKIKPEIIAL